jgi:hypothetical protein
VQIETDNASIKKSNHLPTFSLLYMVEVILSQGKLKKKKKNRAEE